MYGCQQTRSQPRAATTTRAARRRAAVTPDANIQDVPQARRTRSRRRPQTTRIGLLTVGETARILGVSPSTLRLWENVGLVTPARSNGRYRLYSQELLEVLKRIKYLRDVKLLNLPGIRQALGTTAPQKPHRGSQPTDLGRKLRRFRKKCGLGVVEAAKRAKI